MTPKHRYQSLSSAQLSYSSAWGFMGFIDLDRYDANLGGKTSQLGRAWTPAEVLERALQHMNNGLAFFWGSADADNQININPANFQQLRATALQRFQGAIEISQGRLCLTGFSGLAAIAQLIDKDELPFWEDYVWNVSPGWYSIEVLQFSRYDGSAQCIGDVDPEFEDGATHHAIQIEQIESGRCTRYLELSNQPAFFYPKKRK
ncbi:MAG: hypothetical protein QM715_16110 [Nibricoccus sp.]